MGVLGAASTSPVSAMTAGEIAARLGWPEGATEVVGLDLDGLAGCTIYDVQDRRVLDGAGVSVARLPDGSWVTGRDPEAASLLLGRCVHGTTPAGTAAEIVARFAPGRGPFRVVHDDGVMAARLLLRRAHAAFAPPRRSADPDGARVTFLALSPGGDRLFRVTGRWRTGGTLTVEVARLAP